MQIVSMKTAGGTSKIKAFFDLETPDHIIIKGFKLAEGPNGLFVGMPSEKGSNGKWFDRIVMPKEIKDVVTDLALVEYKKLEHSSIKKTNSNESIIEAADQPF